MLVEQVITATVPGYFEAMGRMAKGTGDTLDIPAGAVNIGGISKGYMFEGQTDWDPTAAGNHDGTVSSLTLGDDVYIYACQPSSGSPPEAVLVASKNATYPDGGYDETDSRKIGGFHFGKVRTIAQAYSSGATLATQIVPNSVWDLKHRPTCDPTGMVEVIDGKLWVDIYLASEDGTAWPETVPLSRYGATPMSGAEGYASGLDYPRLTHKAGKRVWSYDEFLVAAYGVPQGAAGGTSRHTTGDHSGYGFDAVSCLNVDQPSGNLWQATSLYFDRGEAANAWNDTLNTGKDSAVAHGQWHGGQFRFALVGGYWGPAAEVGARCVTLRDNPWNVSSTNGLRAVCDSL